MRGRLPTIITSDKLPENIIIGGLNDNSPRAKDAGAISSVGPVANPVAFTVNGIECAVVSDTNGGKLLCILHDGSHDLFQTFGGNIALSEG